MPKVTLDYSDIVGALYLSGKDADEDNPPTVQESKDLAQFFFDYIEKWQQSGLALESLENDTSN